MLFHPGNCPPLIPNTTNTGLDPTFCSWLYSLTYIHLVGHTSPREVNCCKRHWEPQAHTGSRPTAPDCQMCLVSPRAHHPVHHCITNSCQHFWTQNTGAWEILAQNERLIKELRQKIAFSTIWQLVQSFMPQLSRSHPYIIYYFLNSRHSSPDQVLETPQF